MKKIHPFIFVYFIVISLYSQNKSIDNQTVKGHVIDFETKQAIEFASITFTSNNSKLLTKGAITDAKGNFKIELPKGIYDIKVDFLSFEPIYLKDVVLQKNITLDTFELKIAVEGLEEVNVAGANKPVAIKLDRMVYFVDKDLTIAGGSALNALKSIPNVSVDAEGKVSLRNDSNVKILINGKQSAQSNSDILNNFQSESIEKVEVITVPSSSFSASGTAGIINIILKKGKNSGFNATVNLTAGNPDYYGFATNLNYKKESINLYSTTGYLQRDTPGNSFIYNTFKNNNIITGFLNDERNYDREKSVFSTLFGIDYEINPSTTFNTTATIKIINGDNSTSNYSKYWNENKTLIQTFEKFDNSKINNDLWEVSLNYQKKFKKEGHQLSIHYTYEQILDKTNSLFTNYNSYPTVFHQISKDLNIFNHQNNDTQLFGFDYALPFGEKSLLEMGYEAYLEDLATNYNYKSYDIATQSFINNPSFTNIFDYNSNVHSFYSTLGSSYKKLSYSAGLRVEIADVNYMLEKSADFYNHKKTDFFPSTHITYEFSETGNLTFSYGKRISRPEYWILNPFETKISETNIVVGNPKMEPFFIHLYELKHVKNGQKLTLSSSIYIKDYTNAPERVTFSTGELVNGIPVEMTTYKNIAALHQIGFEQFANFTPFKWWQLSGGFNIYQSKQKGIFKFKDFNNIPKTIDFSSNDFSGYFSLSSKFTLPKEWRLQTSYKYFAPSEGAISKRKEYYFMDAAISKNLFNNKASITFSVTDIFNSHKIERNIITGSANTHNMFQWNERMFIFNFTYRINQKDKKLNFEVDKDKSIMF